ncbi:glutaredoxin family protein [Kineococcus sp. SYSU DK002]|uniref:glutaredoxin family protein n=1 Tax=Kineococcus sp. SYSU DK002 TaxID=3383123 RepID=UPI003D7CA993
MEPVDAGPAADGAGTGAELVVYGADWCPDVRRSRALLEAEGTAHRYVDVETDPAATELVRRLQGGARRIPTIVWPDGSHLVEPSDDELRARLRGPAA